MHEATLHCSSHRRNCARPHCCHCCRAATARTCRQWTPRRRSAMSRASAAATPRAACIATHQEPRRGYMRWARRGCAPAQGATNAVVNDSIVSKLPMLHHERKLCHLYFTSTYTSHVFYCPLISCLLYHKPHS